MPPLPAARTFTRANGLIGTAAVTASAAPFFFFLPGAEERLASQAAKWGPRWERNLSHIAPRMENGVSRLHPGMQKNVKKVEPPLKRSAEAIDRSVKRVLKVEK